jgi:hypothetical protein
MTEDEVRKQKALLLLDVNEAEQELAQLEEKGKRISIHLKGFAEWLDGVLRAGMQYGASGEAYISAIGKVNVLHDAQFKISMNFDEAVKLFDQLTAVRKRLNDLNERKRSLGLR